MNIFSEAQHSKIIEKINYNNFLKQVGVFVKKYLLKKPHFSSFFKKFCTYSVYSILSSSTTFNLMQNAFNILLTVSFNCILNLILHWLSLIYIYVARQGFFLNTPGKIREFHIPHLSGNPVRIVILHDQKFFDSRLLLS